MLSETMVNTMNYKIWLNNTFSGKPETLHNLSCNKINAGHYVVACRNRKFYIEKIDSQWQLIEAVYDYATQNTQMVFSGHYKTKKQALDRVKDILK